MSVCILNICNIYIYKYYIKSWIYIYIRVCVCILPSGLDGKRICWQCGRPRFDPWVRKILWRREWQPTPVFLPGKFHGQRSLVGYSPQGHQEADTFLFTFTCMHEHMSTTWYCYHVLYTWGNGGAEADDLATASQWKTAPAGVTLGRWTVLLGLEAQRFATWASSLGSRACLSPWHQAARP